MRDAPLAWRVEECCHNAWPALRQVWIGDWVLRFADGVSRRANSANPLRAGPRDPAAAIAAAETLFPAHGLPAIFRVPAMVAPAIDARLAARGYTAEGETATLHAGLDVVAAAADPAVAIWPRPHPDWLRAMAALQGHTRERAETYRRIVELIAIPAAFGGLRQDGRLVALAYGAVHDGLLCFESVVTDPAHRGRGYGRRLLAAIAHWGRGRGAVAACLQVEATNAPALAFYRGLGLKAELYRYHYRRRAAP